jgi:hypothetical protein
VTAARKGRYSDYPQSQSRPGRSWYVNGSEDLAVYTEMRVSESTGSARNYIGI